LYYDKYLLTFVYIGFIINKKRGTKMNNKAISRCIFVVLTFLIVLSILMCVFWLPNVIEYLHTAINIDKITVTIACAIIATFLFTVLIIGYYFSYSVSNDTIFSNKTAAILKIISIIIFCDCIVLFSVNAIFLSKGEKILSYALLFISVLGIMIAYALFILSKYVKKATKLKEEVDATL